MSEPSVNPYQSPFAADARDSFVMVEDPQSLAELQERIRRLEEQLKANWFCGAFWKRMLAVVAYLMLAYVFLLPIIFLVSMIVAIIEAANGGW
jgi:hypothetical protein